MLVVNLALGLVNFDFKVVIPVFLDWWVVDDCVAVPGLVLLLVLTVSPELAQYSRAGTAGSSNSGVRNVDIAFYATEDWNHGLVPTCRASLLTVSSNLTESLAVPHVKYVHIFEPRRGCREFRGADAAGALRPVGIPMTPLALLPHGLAISAI